jgi:hypothetical protein
MVIRPQAPWARAAAAAAQQQSGSHVVSAFQSAASTLASSRAAPQQPAYRTAAPAPRPPAAPAASGAAAMNPLHWPPALKAYVERAFKTSSLGHRTKLQDVLRCVITDAQAKGAGAGARVSRAGDASWLLCVEARSASEAHDRSA